MPCSSVPPKPQRRLAITRAITGSLQTRLTLPRTTRVVTVQVHARCPAVAQGGPHRQRYYPRLVDGKRALWRRPAAEWTLRWHRPTQNRQPPGIGKPAIRTPGTSSGGPDRPILSPTVALVAILLVVLVLLVGGGLFLREFNARVTPVAAAPTTVAVSAPTLPAAPTAPPRTLAAATLPPSTSTAATPLPTSRPTAVPTAVATAQPTTDQHCRLRPLAKRQNPALSRRSPRAKA